MKLVRGSGLLLHITSLPSKFGIGDLGPQAFSFIDQLSIAKQKYWQILPLNPTDSAFGNSPYLSASAFAMNPLIISPALLQQAGLLSAQQLKKIQVDASPSVDFELVQQNKAALLELAFKNWQPEADFTKFKQEQKFWLEDFALFTAIKKENDGKSWIEWPAKLRDRDKKALAKKQQELAQQIQFVEFVQFLAHQQWQAVKQYANEKNIQIIGDLPIYIEYGSCDVWCYPHLFKLDAEKKPYVVAGVPPDYFSKTGQRWGNPIYNWQEMQKHNFAWWSQRLSQNLRLFDIVRIDHFRGLVAYWQVPAEEETAINGTWVEAPTDALLAQLQKACPHFNVIAEDLGLITDDVRNVLKAYHLPGMKVLLFAFNSDTESNLYLPHHYDENCLVYTGTHDNNTAVGWYNCDATDVEKWNMGVYMQHGTDAEHIHWHLIEMAAHSRANVAIFPVQDILGLDEASRMNIPGTSTGNWLWRLLPEQLHAAALQQLKEVCEKSGRV